MIIKTWMLIAYMATSGYNVSSGGPVLVDNISSQAECERVRLVVQETPRTTYARCIEVSKLK